jgi:hypothetical protein
MLRILPGQTKEKLSMDWRNYSDRNIRWPRNAACRWGNCYWKPGHFEAQHITQTYVKKIQM